MHFEEGNYIVTEDSRGDYNDVLSRITSKGERAIIRTFSFDSHYGLVSVVVAPEAMAGDEKGVIQYWGDSVVDLTEDPDGNPIGPGTATAELLPGGRWLYEWMDGSEYAAHPDVTMDLISGKWYFTV